MSDAAQEWQEQALYDLETARAMLDSGRFLYIQSRYPEEIRKMGSSIRREVAEIALQQTEAEIQWLSSMLT